MTKEQKFKRKEIIVTTSRELKIMVQNFMNVADIAISARKQKIILCRYLVVHLAMKYTQETWNEIANTLRYKDHASISHAMKQWEILKGQRVLDPYEFLANKISNEMDYRIVKRKEENNTKNISLEDLQNSYRIKMWKMNRMHHSIRKKLVDKIDELENENKRLKNIGINEK